MLSCRELVEKVNQEPDLIDKKTSAGWGVCLHLMLCTHCRRYVRQLRLMLSFLSLAPKPEPAEPEVADRIWCNIRQHKGGA